MSNDAANDDQKACPFCGESIKRAAKICRFCGMDLATGQNVWTKGSGPRPAGEEAPCPAVEEPLWQDNPSNWAYFWLYLIAAILIPAVVGIPLLIWAILDRRRTVYTVTSRRVIQKRGIIGSYLSEVDLEDIRNVIVEYGVTDRLFGIGNIGVATAGQGGIEVKLLGCSNPEGVRQLISEAKHRVRS